MKVDLDMAESVKIIWHRFVKHTEPIRPELYQFCRSLTGNTFDAEDLVQSTLTETFTSLALLTHPIEDLLIHCLRFAGRLWLQRIPSPEDISVTGVQYPEIQSGAQNESSIYRVSITAKPQAAPTLDRLSTVLDLSADQTDDLLRTRRGVAASMLSSDRKMREHPERGSEAHRQASDSLVDNFVSAFNRKDLKALTCMMHANAVGEGLGMGAEYGRAAIGRENDKACLYVTLFLQNEPLRAERTSFARETLVLIWVGSSDNQALNDIIRLEEKEGSIIRFRWYYFCPELLTEVAKGLSIPVRTNGYRFDFEAELESKCGKAE